MSLRYIDPVSDSSSAGEHMVATLTFHKTTVGLSSWHRHWIQGQLAGKVDVPCGDCTLCCRCYDEIALLDGDNPANYLTKPGSQGRTVLQQHDDGSCIYLVNEKCTIYGKQPLTCKRFDCRMFLTLPESYFTDAAPIVKRVRENAASKFTLAIREPDDQTFHARLTVHAERLAKQLYDAVADATLGMATILAVMSPRRIRARIGTR